MIMEGFCVANRLFVGGSRVIAAKRLTALFSESGEGERGGPAPA